MTEPEPQPQRDPRYAHDAIHLVRTAQQIQMQLSAMADQKASILMGATFVVFTISINQWRSGDLAPEMLVLGTFSFIAAVLAVLAVLPVVHPKAHAPLNLVFFGSFTKLAEEDYLKEMEARLHDEAAVLRTMARDIYQNGVVLERKKYRFLGYAYRVFLLGLVSTFIVFVAEYF